jgi:hypothetical protein
MAGVFYSEKLLAGRKFTAVKIVKYLFFSCLTKQKCRDFYNFMSRRKAE